MDIDRLAGGISDLFTSVHQSERNEKVSNLYADDFYYNDTLHTFRNLDQLLPYLDGLNKKLEQNKVTIDDYSVSGPNLYLKWNMHMEMKILGKQITSRSIGVSQFQFNNKKKIVFHQDFWDSTEGLFKHIPVVGGLLSIIKSKI